MFYLLFYWFDRLTPLLEFQSHNPVKMILIVISIPYLSWIGGPIVGKCETIRKYLMLLWYEHRYYLGFLAGLTLIGLFTFFVGYQPYYAKTVPGIEESKKDIRIFTSAIKGKELDEMAEKKHEAASKESNFKIMQSLLNPLFLTGILGLIILAFRTGRMQDQLAKQKRLEDLQNIIETMTKHSILLGYGDLGKQTLKEIIRLSEPEKLEYMWEKKEIVCCNLLVVEKIDQKVEFIVGKHPQTGELGLTKIKGLEEQDENYYVPVMIGDINPIVA